jgi:ATP-dependent DNA ligase
MPASRLPHFIEPMLATPGMPFDSQEHFFEIKWDGVRAMAYIESDGYRIMNRRRVDITSRYPEFEFLKDLPPGTVLDGEMVVLAAGKPDFSLLQSREHTRSPMRQKSLSRNLPATLIVFDQIYAGFESCMQEPLRRRRERLVETVDACGSARLVASQGVIGEGVSYYQHVLAEGLEGIVAKRLASVYLPGKRTDAWIKIRRRDRMLCAIIGFIPDGKDFRSLVLACDEAGTLRFCGKVGTGIDTKLRARLNELLWPRLRPKPLVPCRERARWVEPGLYCWVNFLERTKTGELREPVLEELIVE